MHRSPNGLPAPLGADDAARAYLVRLRGRGDGEDRRPVYDTGSFVSKRRRVGESVRTVYLSSRRGRPDSPESRGQVACRTKGPGNGDLAVDLFA